MILSPSRRGRNPGGSNATPPLPRSRSEVSSTPWDRFRRAPSARRLRMRQAGNREPLVAESFRILIAEEPLRRRSLRLYFIIHRPIWTLPGRVEPPELPAMTRSFPRMHGRTGRSQKKKGSLGKAEMRDGQAPWGPTSGNSPSVVSVKPPSRTSPVGRMFPKGLSTNTSGTRKTFTARPATTRSGGGTNGHAPSPRKPMNRLRRCAGWAGSSTITWQITPRREGFSRRILTSSPSSASPPTQTARNWTR